MKEAVLFTNTESNRWVALVRCDNKTPSRIRALSTNDTIVLDFCRGNELKNLVFGVLNSEKYGGTRTAYFRAGSLSRHEWSMYMGGGTTWWRVRRTDSSEIPGEMALAIPDPHIRYDMSVLGTRLMFYGEQVILLPLAVCADVVTCPFQLVMMHVGNQMKKAMWP